jgi:4a-hydroxytetrahydrobiopterin dehydratase
MKKLSPAKVKDVLPEGWRFSGKTLSRKFEFKDFKAAWKFMSKIAKKADATDHHPDWSNVYNKVMIKLSTHDVGGVTNKDIALAEYINKTAE